QRLRLTAVLEKPQWAPPPPYFQPKKHGALVNRKSAELLATLGLPPGRLALCLVGGGQDGASLAEAFAQAELPPKTNALLLTGPCLPMAAQQRLRRLTAGNQHFRVLDFVPEPDLLLCAADHVVAMGGYNTICEVLSFEKRALIVPRVQPRREQLIRAQ